MYLPAGAFPFPFGGTIFAEPGEYTWPVIPDGYMGVITNMAVCPASAVDAAFAIWNTDTTIIFYSGSMSVTEYVSYEIEPNLILFSGQSVTAEVITGTDIHFALNGYLIPADIEGAVDYF